MHVNVMTSMMFASISGSAVAGAAVVGSVVGRSMVEKGISPQYTGALTAAAAVVGPIIPPSIPMIVYAVMTQQSIGKLFVAGFVPGVLIGLVLMAYSYVVAIRRGYARGAPFSLSRVILSGRRAFVALLAPVIIIGGILGGVFTATEAGAIAVAYSFVIGKFVLKELSWGGFYLALVRASRASALVLVVVGASSVMAWVIADQKIASQVSEIIFSISTRPWVVLLMINVFLLIIGLFLDAMASIIILTPIFAPIALLIGVDPTHFGIIMIFNLLIGLLAVITYVPGLVMFIPNMFYD
ncbi:MAG: TRAP transporter large permease, partial [Paracoccaceae bacterium]|nr:TRAP transporter large permease [Paracoccaceae bacterium]